ncbi:hypothetical protein IWX49DRAFT_409700 [Phyllosticta citricarpa]|uniref:Uncharacterized protein n=1 Tax=Phyllosticta paracitricarpa TaxID=2016321 RepID=A0ABR1MSS5_9PEZI
MIQQPIVPCFDTNQPLPFLTTTSQPPLPRGSGYLYNNMADTPSHSTRRHTQRCTSPDSDRITPPASPTPALPLSPTSTAEYWDHALEKHLKERRTKRASKSSRHSRQNRAALEIISSQGEDDPPMPKPDSCSQSSFNFGFPERDRADSAHETEGVVESLKCSQEVQKQKISQTLHVFPPTNKRASGRRREGQTLASPAPLSPTRPKTSSSSPQRRKCPPRPPRPDEILFIPSLCQAAQSSADRSNRSSASRRRCTESIPENSIAEAQDVTPPRSSHSTPSPSFTASAAARSFSEPSPPMTPVHNASFALHQTVSVWDSDDSDDEEDAGLMHYVRRTLHASKSSMSGRTSSDREKREKSRESAASERSKSSDDDQDSKLRERRRRRRSTMREAVIRVFGCGKTPEQSP